MAKLCLINATPLKFTNKSKMKLTQQELATRLSQKRIRGIQPVEGGGEGNPSIKSNRFERRALAALERQKKNRA